MHLAFFVYFFLAATSAGAFSFVPRATVGDVWGGVNITQMVLQVAGAISSPTCNATQPCVNLTTIEIPMCLKVLGNPGCWCANADPIHYCAICMSDPTDRSTTPDQTQAATAGHQNYHIGCNAYEAYLNGTSLSSMGSSTTSSTTSASSSSSTSAAPTIPVQANSGSKSVSPGVVGGIVVGGLFGLGLIGAAVFLIYRHMQNKHQRILDSSQRETILSAHSDFKPPYNPSDNSSPVHVTGYTPPPPNPNPNPFPNLNTQKENVPYDTRMLNLPQV